MTAAKSMSSCAASSRPTPPAWPRSPPSSSACKRGARRYVAMGSSFAAGPGLKLRVKGAPLLAGRSQANYAHLVAARLGLELRDQTYSGATIAEIAGRADAPRARVVTSGPVLGGWSGSRRPRLV